MKIQTTRVYAEIERASKAGYTTISCQGSSRSSKTYNILIWLIIQALSGRRRISVVRATLPALKASAMTDFEEIMKRHRLWDTKAMNRTDRIYRFPNGSTMEFFAASDEQKLRGPKRDILYCNEANELLPIEFQQLKMRTTTLTIIDYNPSFDDEHWICQLNREQKTYHFISTYKDNPFLEQTIIDEIESLQFKNQALWRVYGLGLQAIVEGLVFPRFEETDEIPAYILDHGKRFLGIDFGYTHDPTAIVEVCLFEDACYLDEKCYRTHMLASDIIQTFKECNPHRLKIISESADPRLVQEIYRAGINIHPVNKFPGSIEAGIAKIQEYRLVITKRSDNIRRELKNYTYQQDKEGKWLNQPVDYMNHCFTADTMVLTKDGNKPIVSIYVGDYVWTSEGLKRVTNIYKNGCRKVFHYRLKLCNFTIDITATDNHKVKTQQGWKEFRHLTKGDILYISSPITGNAILSRNAEGTGKSEGSIGNFSKSFMKIISARNRRICTYTRRIGIFSICHWKTLLAALCRKPWGNEVGSAYLSRFLTKKNIGYMTEKGITPEVEGDCILKFGNIIMAKCRKVMRFTTRILILQIMKSRILSACRLRSIGRNTVRKWQSTDRVKSSSDILTPSGMLRRCGTKAMKAESGTENTPRRWEPVKAEALKTNVLSAVKNLLRVPILKNSVQTTANPSGEDYRDLIMRHECVRSVDENLPQTNTVECVSVHADVLQDIIVESEEMADTFDIEVADIHEFFANGILVHNCMDAVRYVFMEEVMGGRRRVDTDRLSRMIY